MDEELVESDVPSAGERLRAAREEKGLTLEDVAAQTRIPRRHLESIETADWAKLPAPTYTIGFARSYASAVGLDRADIADQLRGELGGQRPVSTSSEVFEPADPARTMPKSLVFGAIAAVILLVLLMSWLSRRSLEQADDATNSEVAATAPASTPSAPPPPTAAQQPVVLNAVEPVWLQVYEKGGATLFSGMLQPGQTFAVPQTAAAPLLRTGKPEALRIMVGNSVAPPVGPAATTVADVSLLSADLLRAGPAAAPPVQLAPPAPPPGARAAPRRRRAPGPPPPAPVPAPPPATNSTGA
jgi:cytoskeletal protein RodZ